MSDERGVLGDVKVGPVEIKNTSLYRDGLQPVVEELGKALWVPAALVSRALDPIRGVIWGWDQIVDYVRVEVGRRMQHIPAEDVVTPDVRLAGPTIEALRFSGDTPDVAAMFACLLATGMNRTRAHAAHPCFVEIIKQMTPDEAKIMRLFRAQDEFPILTLYIRPATRVSSHIPRHFSMLGIDADCDFPDMAPTYLDNLCRLGLLEYPPMSHFASDTEHPGFERIRQNTSVLQDSAVLKREGKNVSTSQSVICVTQLGRQFCDACLQTRPNASSG